MTTQASRWRSFVDPAYNGYGVGPLPGRKQVCLYRWEGASLRTIAFFKSELEAQAFLVWLVGVVAAKPCR